ncbi:hypothetical protein HanXRQr2_Chr10g0449681 [Helianthus annuus]|uniref:Uncharacterized protein n=1 Tax=Helianthus annuus TaxID=4232 RepID=A0A251TLZ2_HELAN|nr:hypothetical protein HanXRQr2_Chr10g0449681 [Helianthus annuus]
MCVFWSKNTQSTKGALILNPNSQRNHQNSRRKTNQNKIQAEFSDHSSEGITRQGD